MDGAAADGRFADFDGAALADWLGEHVPEFGSLMQVEKFPGGQSNPTYRIDGERLSLVLRRKPFGDILPSAHAIEREYRLIESLHPTGFPVARPYALCEDPEVIGAPFYLMERVEGRIFWSGLLPELAPADRLAAYEDMVDVLARLHSVNPEAVGLADYGAPGNYFERQVRRWTKQYRASQTDEIAAVERLIDWLPASLPAQSRTAIIHGDYRIDNLVYAPAAPRIAAVLDWELSTLGDPLADFAYLAMNWALPGDGSRAQIGDVDLAASSIPGLDRIVERYCRATGRDGVPDLNWYFAYSLFRLVGIVQGIRKRFLNGNASSADAEAASARVPQLAEQAWAFAEKAGA
ncbi:phosphotransferase family protein [Sphingomonas ginkgonis]|uniref:Phosphotransferase family protein n=1 Tax=Sphingomonas ginkgonis TaxID=2315330 RepID=A0A3S0EMT1_9SPHN|nr:phosphotransferase family protein [Sphingomonas ginkgonis]RST31142.1 phosphotransferase family protein [Sphingomonas ginkgonis]